MLNYLIELRQRTLKIIIFFAVFFSLFFYFATDLFHFFIAPLLHVLTPHDALIATQITASFLIPIHLAANLACLLTAPFALFHVWRFAAPGLYRHERQGLGWAIVGSLFLFSLGVLFCFYCVLPLILQFFVKAVPAQVQLMPDVAYAIDFITHMLVLFGISFQVPLICLLLVRMHLLTIATLKKIRPYSIVASFIVGMLLTPPDVLSQIMLAVPLCLLYELGIFIAIFFAKKAAT